MLRLLHLADLHLGAEPSYLGDIASQRSKDFNNAFERAVEFALASKHNIHLVVIAGDFFDRHNPPQETVRFATRQLTRLRQANIPVVLAPGNHDSISYPDSVYLDASTEIHNLVHLLDSPNVERSLVLELNGEDVHIYGMAWDVNRSTPPFDEFHTVQEDGLHIVVIHGTLDRAHYIEAHKRNVPLTLENLANSKMDYIALGHIHSQQAHQVNSIPVVYPGTLEGKRFVAGEEGQRNLVVVELEKGRQAKIELLPWNQRVLQKGQLDLDTEVIETEDELVDLIRTRFSDPNKLLRLEVSGTPSFVVNVENLKNRLSGDFFWCEFRDQTSIFHSVLVDDWAGEETIRGLLVRKLRRMVDETDDPGEQQKISLALRTAFQVLNSTGGRG
jgi:DNA repair protein SbcD/Mre11